MTPISFFTDDVTLVPHSVSNELAHKLDKPVSIAEFSRLTGNAPVALYETETGELYVVARPRQAVNGAPAFMEGPAHQAGNPQ